MTSQAVGHKACVSQNTKLDCVFSLGNSATQLEFDYHIEGDRWSNWYSFWMNCRSVSADGTDNEVEGWVKDCEIDSLENMWKSFAHNFAGLGH